MNDCKNLLPYDGHLEFIPSWLPEQEATSLFHILMSELVWQQEEIIMYGKLIKSNRKTAWYADSNMEYKYSGKSKTGMTWPPALNKIRNQLDRVTNTTFNGCLANLYHHGKEGMGWHADNEPEIVAGSTIASISLGATRRFQCRHRDTQETIEVMLTHGSLLLMTGTMQQHWKHQIPKMARVTDARINLTFRQMKSPKLQGRSA